MLGLFVSWQNVRWASALLMIATVAVPLPACSKQPADKADTGAATPADATGDPTKDAGLRAVSVMLALGSMVDLDKVSEMTWDAADPDEEVVQTLRRVGGKIEEFIAIPSVDRAGYEWPKEPTRVAALTKQFLSATRLVRLDAERCLGEKNPDGAARRMAAVVRMTRYFSECRYGADTWSAAAFVLSWAPEPVYRDANAIKRAAWRTELAREVDMIDGRNPLGLREAVLEDLTIWRDHLLRGENVTLYSGRILELGLIGKKEREKMAADLLAVKEELAASMMNIDLDAMFRALSKLKSSQVWRVMPSLQILAELRGQAMVGLAKLRAAAM